jgi:putative ABC transport system permease protein
MIRHLLKLVWNRRRSNALIAFEVLLSYLVLVAVATTGIYLWNNYRQPLGFTYDNTWSVRVSMAGVGGPGVAPPAEQTPAALRARVSTLVRVVRDLPETAAAAAVGDAPYVHSGWFASLHIGGKDYQFGANRADDDFAATVGLTITRGRWFNASDEGDQYEPVVINERFARALFGREDPVGKIIKPDPEKRPGPPRPTIHIIGVMLDYRKDGELSLPVNWVFYRVHAGREAPGGPGVPRYIVVRAQPGTTAAFEARFMKRLNQAAPDWSFRAKPLVLARAGFLREGLPQLGALGLIALFLLVMVTLGLTGVLWLMVTQRTREIGVRRAKGATAVNIQRQVLGEILTLTAVAVAVGTIIAAQFPALDVFGNVEWSVYLAGMLCAIVCIFTLAAACAWVPSRLASSIDPAEALRYE